MKIEPPIFFLLMVIVFAPEFVNCQTWLNVKEVFDFSPGSFFHYSSVISGYETSEQTATTYLVTSRTDSSDITGDTISILYTVLVHQKYENSITAFANYERTFQSVWYYDHLNDSISSEKNIQFSSHYYGNDSIGRARFTTCSERYNYLDDKSQIHVIEKKQWAKGLGLISHNYSEFSNSDQFKASTQLVYYKKSGQAGCGTPLSNGKGLTDICNSTILSVFPNPSTDILNVVFIKGYLPGYSLHVTDVSGQIVSLNELKLRFNSIDISTFKRGVYFLKVTNGNGNSVITEKLVKE